tara:strand:+ start:1665 stop:1994 length:330 start_codon:yes stop_codon:yes gene_type:complete
MNCEVCSGKGNIEIERFGRTSVHVCYVCEGAGKIKQCSHCNGSGEKIIQVGEIYDFSPCLVCVGNGVIPLIETCQNCNDTGMVVSSHTVYYDDGSREMIYEPDICGCKE